MRSADAPCGTRHEARALDRAFSVRAAWIHRRRAWRRGDAGPHPPLAGGVEMKRLFPAPELSVALLLLWILLMQALDAGTVLLGVVMAFFWPLATARLGPPRESRRPLVLARLCGRVFLEMLRSNVEVAWAILTRRSSDIPSGFIHVPLELRNPNGLAGLAMIVTFTPGTAWAQLSADRRVLSCTSSHPERGGPGGAHQAPLRAPVHGDLRMSPLLVLGSRLRPRLSHPGDDALARIILGPRAEDRVWRSTAST